MREHERESARDDAFEALLAQSVAELPPEEIVADVTPWRRAMNRILFGMALCAITLNFWCLNYILPAIGTVLLLLGFRTLRRENRWLGGCFAVTVIRAACFFATLILNTTILQSAVFTPAVTTTLTVINAVLLLALYFCFWRGLLAVQKKAGLPAQAGGALALIVWYALVCVLAAVHYTGWIVPIAMLVGYGCILRSLYRLSGALDEAGYAIAPGPVRVTDRCLVLVIAAVLGIGCTLGYLFGSSYRMDWQPADTSKQTQTEAIRQQLLDLGFPEAVLNDLTPEDIAACDGALRVVVETEDYPVNDGRNVLWEAYNEKHERYYVQDTVYDVKELRLTGVAVQLPGERETWMVFHHFLWTADPGFYGTEAIQIRPAYRSIPEGWSAAGDVTGRVLYDRDGQTFAAPYASLGAQTFTANTVLWGEQTNTDLFAAFSLPRAWGALPRLCRLLHHRGAQRLYLQQRGVLRAPADLAAVPRRDGDGKAPDGRLGRHGRIPDRAGCAAVLPRGRTVAAMSAKNRPEQAFGSVLLCTGSGVRLILAVGGHDVAEDLAVGRRRPRDSVGACFDGLEDALIRRAAGRNDGHVGVLLADAAHDGRRLRCGGNVEDVRAGADALVKVGVRARDREHDGDVDRLGHVRDDGAGRRRVEHDAGRALHLGEHGEVDHALALREAAADAGKHRDIGREQQRLRDDRLRRERVDRDDGVRVHVFDDGQVGREHERLDTLAKNHDAAALIDDLRHAQGKLAQRAVHGLRHGLFRWDYFFFVHFDSHSSIRLNISTPVSKTRSSKLK